MPIAWKVWAFFKRDLRTDLSYKLSFAFGILNVLVGIGSYFFLSRILGKAAFRGYDPFPFILVGVAVNGYMSTCLGCFALAIRGNQPLGTLKAVLVTPTSPVAFVLFSSVYPLARAVFDAVLYLFAGAIFGLSLGRVNLPAVVLLFLLSAAAFASIGILSAAFALVFKRGDPFLWMWGSLSWLLGGVFYPVQVLPRFLQHAAQLLPITHALAGMRAAVLHHASIAELLPEIGVLGLFGIVGMPLSLLAFHLGVRSARITGTLSHF